MSEYLLRLGAEEAYKSHNKVFGMVDDFQNRLCRVKNFKPATEKDKEEVYDILWHEVDLIVNEMKVGHKWLCALKE